MSTKVQWRRGTTAQNDAFTGAPGEVTVDTTLNRLRLHDGVTAGGFDIGELAQATQAAIEAETDENSYVAPDLIKHSPGVAKVLVKWEQTGAHGIKASYNMTSVTDGGGAGVTDHLWNVDFSSIEYEVIPGSTNNRLVGTNTGTIAVGGVTTTTAIADTNVPDDEDHNSMAVYGDQA